MRVIGGWLVVLLSLATACLLVVGLYGCSTDDGGMWRIKARTGDGFPVGTWFAVGEPKLQCGPCVGFTEQNGNRTYLCAEVIRVEQVR